MDFLESETQKCNLSTKKAALKMLIRKFSRHSIKNVVNIFPRQLVTNHGPYVEIILFLSPKHFSIDTTNQINKTK